MAARSKGMRARSRAFRSGSRYRPLLRAFATLMAQAIWRSAVFSTVRAAGEQSIEESTKRIASSKVRTTGGMKASTSAVVFAAGGGIEQSTMTVGGQHSIEESTRLTV